jgi:hypothetical protein
MLAFYMWAFGMLQRVLLVVSLTRGGIGAALVSLMCPATQSRDTFFCTSVRPSQAAASAMFAYILEPWSGAGEFTQSAALQGRESKSSQGWV